MVEVVPMTPEHWPSVREIYLEGIATRNATFETSAPDWTTWDQRYLEIARLVAIDEGTVVGWAALSAVSRRAVYRGVAEVSVYVAADHRGAGIGSRLLDALVEASEAAGVWTLQASVFPENEATLRLHHRREFRTVGHRERIGKLDGRWRDTVLLERRSRSAGVE